MVRAMKIDETNREEAEEALVAVNDEIRALVHLIFQRAALAVHLDRLSDGDA